MRFKVSYWRYEVWFDGLVDKEQIIEAPSPAAAIAIVEASDPGAKRFIIEEA
jgi:hypothetical protein